MSIKGRTLCFVVTSLALFHFVAETIAVTQFKRPFLKRYVDGTDNTDFQKAVRKANCTLCHIKGEKKEACNDYGLALGALIEGNPDERLKEAKVNGKYAEELAKLLAELEIAFEKVELRKSPTGGTYGDRLRAGKLPCSD